MRLDNYVALNNNISRNKASELIQNSCVSVNANIFLKKSYIIKNTDTITIVSKGIQYVARSAYKLEHFIKKIDITGATCLDIGFSTGGFVQCLLHKKANKVFAVDVGKDQLHPSLDRTNIVLFEQTDIRLFKSDVQFDIITCDISFLSVEHFINSINRLSNSSTKIFLLLKPQFEIKGFKDKKGVLNISDAVIQKKLDFQISLIKQFFTIVRNEKAHVKGKNGNQEYLLELKKIAK